MADDNSYHYTECGIDNIYLTNGFRLIAAPRSRQLKITDIDGLHVAIGTMLVDQKKNLTGKEIRFLRHEMLMSQGVLARLLEVDDQTVARWEKGKTEPAKPAETLIRLLYREHVGKSPVGLWQVRKSLEILARLEEEGRRRIVFRHAGNKWRREQRQAA